MNILLFTGLSAAGKSTLAEILNEHLNYYFIRERILLHELANSRGYSRVREWLSAENINTLLESARSETITRMRVAQPAIGVIIDGTYDKKFPSELSRSFPEANLTIINIIATDAQRKLRMQQRINADEEAALKERTLIDGFKKEAGVEEIIGRANINIENNFLPESLGHLYQELSRRGILVTKERSS